jgi:hypothetical protein
MSTEKFSLATQLEGQFLRREVTDGHIRQIPVDTLAEAQGVRFLCPKCFRDNGGNVGTHQVICWSAERGTPADATPGPGRWKMEGTGLEDLTLSGENGKSSSVWLTGGCGYHGFIKNGLADIL